MSVIADIRAAEAIHEVSDVPIQPRGPYGESLELVFAKKLKLVVTVNQRKNVHLEDGTVDWDKVRRVKIKDIEIAAQNDV